MELKPVIHAHWTERMVEMDKYGIFRHRWHCSACGGWQTYGEPYFCPMCGAKMDEEAGKENNV